MRRRRLLVLLAGLAVVELEVVCLSLRVICPSSHAGRSWPAEERWPSCKRSRRSIGEHGALARQTAVRAG
jgi:hypothetical protein